ncbi:MAG: citronellol/citronellal dehydrogenase [Thermoleophilaceae bacterium]|nr:citronellol/citronellal dehydrogenase [Thermoleophilaceae bacterium]
MPSQIFAPGLLDGQVVLVTGGGSGLGRATAVELTACGARVVVAGRRLEPLEQTVAECEGGLCEPVACDIREEDQVAALVDGTLERHGRIDTLVNNAGGQYMSPAEDLTPKGFSTVIGLNLGGTWLMTHAVATKAMIPAGGGKILNVTLSPHHGLPGMTHSSAARAGVENMTRVLSIEWARFGIKLTAIAAGHFETEAIQKYPKPVAENVARTVPLGRLGQPEEHAWLVAYLASPAGDYYSGGVITLDGARDNWFGPWPPPGMTDEGTGKPLAEERRPKKQQ